MLGQSTFPDNSHLLLQIGHGRFTATDSNETVAFDIPVHDTQGAAEVMARKIYETEGILTADYDACICLIDSDKYFVLPDGEKITASLMKGLRSTFWPSETLTMESCPIPGTGLQIVYALPTAIDSFMRRSFPDIRYRHALVPVAEYFRATAPDDNRPGILLTVSPDGRQISYCAMRDGKVSILGECSVTSSADIVYYLGVLSEHGCGLAASDNRLWLLGAPSVVADILHEAHQAGLSAAPLYVPRPEGQARLDPDICTPQLLLLNANI